MEGTDRKAGPLGGEDSDVELYSPVSIAFLGADGELLSYSRPKCVST